MSFSLELFSASTNGKKANSFFVHAGSTVPFYIANPVLNDKQTKNSTLGQYLQGTMTILKVKIPADSSTSVTTIKCLTIM